MSDKSVSVERATEGADAPCPEFVLADLDLWFRRILNEHLRGHAVREHGSYGAVVNTYAAAEIPDWELRQKQDLVRDAINGVNGLLAERDALREALESNNVGLNLLRQLVSGNNALRDLDVFACNGGEHEAGCECFWEQCEAWALADAALATAQHTQTEEK